MEQRSPSRLNRDLSVIGLGTWQLGADWGDVEDAAASAVLDAARSAGVTFFDTADVYGDGRSEKFIGNYIKKNGSENLTVATKMGRRADPHVPEAFTLDNFRSWTDRSRENLGVDTLDLVQLHCPPTPVFSADEVYDHLDLLVDEGRIAKYGVSVETCAEALTAIARPNVASIQIILNIFRRKPLEEVLPTAKKAGVAIIARVPLASGLLSGKYDENTTFPENDHRNFNRQGAAFDVGETFSGVPFEVGLKAAREVAALTPEGLSTAQFALRWVIDQPGVATVIPGARNPVQARANAEAAAAAPLTDAQIADLEAIYDKYIREHVHEKW
ncbi:MAG TPA: aldo/keto reductase [Actinomycetales bacterium]|nr:aldo/keto reductase [Actinomycetales bacterium]